MIQELKEINISDFNKDTLKKLKPYFDLNIAQSTASNREQWFHNLLTLAKYDLSIAHCVQHNHYSRLAIETKFQDQLPEFYDPTYENQIGCYSNFKAADSMRLNDNTVSGTKHWISLVDRADFGIFRVPVKDTEAYIMINFAEARPIIDLSYTTPIGMQIARPGSITLNNYVLPSNSILGYKKYNGPSPEFFQIIKLHNYCFVTNYLGIVISLYQELGQYLERASINVDYDYKKLGLAVSALLMMWQDNLSSVHTVTPSDNFWHRYSTQYTQSKNVLLEIISLILHTGDSRWVDAVSPANQRFRDALSFSSHMKPLYKNLEEKLFVKF
jgi:hypothetical protein